MISSIEWIPAGVADPNPKKYEMSSMEQELIQLMQEQGTVDEKLVEERDKLASKASLKTKLPKLKNSLPADLRMDEYSSDEDDDRGAAIGRLLVGPSASLVGDAMEDLEGNDDDDADDADDDNDDNNDGNVEGGEKENDGDGRDKDSDTDDSDDDLDDVPDTREYEPVDVEGLQAMGFSNVGLGSAMYMNGLGQDDVNDDDSEADDVALTADDALVVIAKTEDVSLPRVGVSPRSFSARVAAAAVASETFTPRRCYYRILLRWRFTCTTKGREIYTCTTTFHCPRFPFVSLMDRSAAMGTLATFVRSGRSVPALKFGISTS